MQCHGRALPAATPCAGQQCGRKKGVAELGMEMNGLNSRLLNGYDKSPSLSLSIVHLYTNKFNFI